MWLLLQQSVQAVEISIFEFYEKKQASQAWHQRHPLRRQQSATIPHVCAEPLVWLVAYQAHKVKIQMHSMPQ